MDEILNSLNEKQKEAVTNVFDHIRIVAGAGSGKTRVLMARIEYLIRQCNIQPWRIMAITFTNKAAQEMKDRLEKRLPLEAKEVKISTIHSLCVRMLRQDGERLGYPKGFVILDGDDQKSLVTSIYDTLESRGVEINRKTETPAKMLGFISRLKMKKNNPADLDMSDVRMQVYKEYQERLAQMKAMDFDDLLLNAQKLLKTQDDVRLKWQNRLDYIHVDEFQDVDPVQYDIIRMLTGENTLLCVVGDPDQTIYTWRGARVDIIMNFQRDFDPCKTIILDENYRSTQPILEASNGLIAHNTNRVEKNLVTKKVEGDPVVLHAAEDSDQESLWIGKQAVKLKGKGTSFSDMAVLYRANYQSRQLEKMFRQLQIPYRIIGALRFYERMEIKDMLAYLQLVAKPDPDNVQAMHLDLAVMRVINQPRRSIGNKTVADLAASARKRGINLLDAARDPQGLSNAAAAKVKRFAALIDELRSSVENMPLNEIVMHIAEKTGYKAMVEAANEEERMENIMELQNDLGQALLENPELTLEEYLQDVALLSSVREDKEAEAVTFMTVHSAKGMEFDAVFVFGMMEGVFPSMLSLKEGGMSRLEEERRLMYVAMTRARNHLFVSWNNGYNFRDQGMARTSRFIAEIPKQWTDQKQRKTIPAQSLSEMSQSSSSSSGRLGNLGSIAAKHTVWRNGDIVEHPVFGEGVVLKKIGSDLSIAFPKPYFIQKMPADHPKLTRKARKS